MAECSLCGSPIEGKFCTRCYPQYASPSQLDSRALVAPTAPPSPLPPESALTSKGAVIGGIALFAVVLLGVLGVFLLADDSPPSAASGTTYQVPVSAVEREVDRSLNPPRLEFRTWQPGDRVELTGAVTRTRENSRGVSLEIDGYDFQFQGIRRTDYPLGAKVVVTLTVERRHSPSLGTDIEWFREDLGKDPPADLLLPASTLRRAT